MDDRQIVKLFFDRDEQAIAEFTASYRRYLIGIAREITGDLFEAEECFSDTCLALWSSIPPESPVTLRAYASRICKNKALNRMRERGAGKRSAILVELDECVSELVPDVSPSELGEVIDRFLVSLPRSEAAVFYRRYNCSESVKNIAREMGIGENKVSKILSKTRRKLKKLLEKEGIEI
jgi:RNA polymerase sigma-70 factor (ECF subfamily)